MEAPSSLLQKENSFYIYIDKNSPEIENYRFNVISLDLDADVIKIFKNAFQPDTPF